MSATEYMSEPALAAVRVSSRMVQMRDFVAPHLAVNNGGYAIQRPDRTADLLVRAGTNRTLHIIREDSDSATGWSYEDLDRTQSAPMPGRRTISYQHSSFGDQYVGVSNGSTTWVFAVVQMPGSVGIGWTIREEDGTWPDWLNKTPIAAVGAPGRPEQVELRVALVDNQPVLLAWMYFQGCGDQPEEWGLWQVRYENGVATKIPHSHMMAQNVWVETESGPGILGFRHRGSNLSDLVFLPYPFDKGKPRTVHGGLPHGWVVGCCLATTKMPNKASRVFLGATNRGYREFPTGIYGVDLDGGRGFHMICRTDQPDELYASASSDGATLFYTYVKKLFVLQERNGAWTEEPFDLGVVADSVTVAPMAPDQTDLFIWNQDRLVRLWENPAAGAPTGATTPGQDPTFWRHRVVELSGQKMLQRAYYVTKLTLLDDKGDLLPQREVSITAGQSTRIRVGEIYTVLDERPSTHTSDLSGSITFWSPTTRIDVGELFVAEGHAAPFNVMRNATEVKKLGNVKAHDIKKKLPAEHAEKTAEALVKAVQQAVAYANSPAAPAIPGQRTRISPSAVRDAHWSFRFHDGQAVFNQLSKDEAQARVAAVLKSAPPEGPRGVDTLWSWLGDLLQDVESGVETTFELIVQGVEDGVEFTVQVVSDGVTYVYQGAKGFVDEAIAFAQDILGIFLSAWDILKLVFLGMEDFKDDIWRAKRFLEAHIQNGMGGVSEKLTHLKRELKQNDLLKPSHVAEQLRRLASSEEGSTSFASAARTPSGGARAAAPDTIIALFQEHAVVIESVLKYVGDSALSMSAAPQWVSDSGLGVLSRLATDLRAQVKAISAEDNVKDALNALREAGKNSGHRLTSPSAIAATTFGDVLGWVKGSVEPLIAQVPNLSDGLFGFVTTGVDRIVSESVLSTELGVSGAMYELYNSFNPGEREAVTLAGVVALFAAIPITLFCRVALHAPWVKEGDEATPWRAGATLAADGEGGGGGSRDDEPDYELGLMILDWVWVPVDASLEALGDRYDRIGSLLFPLQVIPIISLVLHSKWLDKNPEHIRSDLLDAMWVAWGFEFLNIGVKVEIGIALWVGIVLAPLTVGQSLWADALVEVGAPIADLILGICLLASAIAVVSVAGNEFSRAQRDLYIIPAAADTFAALSYFAFPPMVMVSVLGNIGKAVARTVVWTDQHKS